jgi:hypothetical protein
MRFVEWLLQRPARLSNAYRTPDIGMLHRQQAPVAMHVLSVRSKAGNIFCDHHRLRTVGVLSSN